MICRANEGSVTDSWYPLIAGREDDLADAVGLGAAEDPVEAGAVLEQQVAGVRVSVT